MSTTQRESETPRTKILERIQNYLETGGLFNPEMMEHEKVRDLIMECRYDLRELYEIREHLWPNQTGLPNEYRNTVIAIKARERLLTKARDEALAEVAALRAEVEELTQERDLLRYKLTTALREIGAAKHADQGYAAIAEERDLAASQAALTECEAKVTEMRVLIDDAAHCFYGPEEQKPGTWGFDVARKLHECSKSTTLGAGWKSPVEVAALRKAVRGCPCELVEPCSPSCTCANGMLSGGCSRCARYGSLEQRTEAAKWLVEQEAKLSALQSEVERFRNEIGGKFDKPITSLEDIACFIGFLAGKGDTAIERSKALEVALQQDAEWFNELGALNWPEGDWDAGTFIDRSVEIEDILAGSVAKGECHQDAMFGTAYDPNEIIEPQPTVCGERTEPSVD